MNSSTQQIAEYENNLRNLQGTLAVEAMVVVKLNLYLTEVFRRNWRRQAGKIYL